MTFKVKDEINLDKNEKVELVDNVVSIKKKSYNMTFNWLLTLSHAEGKQLSKKLIVKQLLSFFERNNIIVYLIVVTEELHKQQGAFHFHVAIRHSGWNTSVGVKALRQEFAMFPGRGLDLKVSKSINAVLEYITKSDKFPECFGITSQEVFEIVDLIQKKKGNNMEYIQRLRECNTWSEVLNDVQLSRKLVNQYNSIKSLWEDLQHDKFLKSIKDKKSFDENFLNNPSVEFINSYDFKNFASHHLEVMRWLFKNLKNRKLKDKQLIVVGAPDVGKSFFILHLLDSLNLSVFETISEDFSDYNETFDIIFIDEFDIKKFSRSFLLKLLEGRPVQFSGKYKRVAIKNRNVPVILCVNPELLPNKDMSINNALYARLEIVEFKKQKFPFKTEIVDLELLKNTFFNFVKLNSTEQQNLIEMLKHELLTSNNNNEK